MAKPASLFTNLAGPLARIGDPLGSSLSLLLASSGDLARPSSLYNRPLASPTNKDDTPAESRTPQVVASIFSAGEVSYPLANQVVTSWGVALIEPKTPSQPAPQGLGAIIYNTFGKSAPNNSGIETKVNTITIPTTKTQKLTIGGGRVISIDPSGMNFEGTTYSIGRPAITLLNKVYTLIPQYGSDNDTSNDNDNTGFYSLPPAPNTFIIAGYTIVPNLIGIVIAGSSVLPGGSAITTYNTPISLDPAGVLLVGSSSFSLPPRPIFTVGINTFTAAPTGFMLNSVIISPGTAI